jgi:NAD(P)H-dependent FMN reductase
MYAGFKGKVVSVMGTSPGPMGGLRMIRSLNQLLQDMGAVVMPGSNAVGNAFQVFDAKEGTIIDGHTRFKVDATCGNLIHFCRYEANRAHDCSVAKAMFELSNMGEYGKVDLPKN